ncbi:MAG: hypothetical protein ACRBFS_09405 [Aureispira sp.]
MKKILFPLVIALTFCTVSCRDWEPGDDEARVVCEPCATTNQTLEDPSLEWGSTQKITKPLQMNAAQTHYVAGTVEYYIENKLHGHITYYEKDGQHYGLKKTREYNVSCGVDGFMRGIPTSKFNTCRFIQQSVEKGS